MNDPVVWLIIAAFYAPLHYLLPVLFIVITAGSEERTGLIKKAIIDCTISMVIIFTLVLWLIPERLMMAMLIMAVGIATPFLRIILFRLKTT